MKIALNSKFKKKFNYNKIQSKKSFMNKRKQKINKSINNPLKTNLNYLKNKVRINN